MKILLLTTHLNRGGVGIYNVNLAKYLKKEGAYVTVASSGGSLESVLDKSGIRCVKFDIKTKAEFGLKVWKALPGLVKFIRDEGFDVVHAHTRITQVLAAVACKITDTSFVTTCHGFFNSNRLSRKLFPCWGEKTVAISESVRRHLIDDFYLTPGRVKLVYTGIELDRYLNASRAPKDLDLVKSIEFPEDVVIVGSVGRYSSVKGYKYLVEGFKDVVSAIPDMRLVLVGEGPEENSLHKQAEELGISDYVFLIKPKVSLEKYFNLFDIFCLPSVHEGLGLSLMEAMAAGVACIASDVGGLRELITDEKDGLLVAPKSPGAINEAIIRLARNGSMRKELANNAQRKARGGFSVEDSVKRTMEVYKELVENKNARE